MILQTHSRITICAAFCLYAAVLSGCKDGGTDPAPAENLTLHTLASHDHSAVPKVSHVGLLITSVKVLLREIRFQSALSDDSTDVEAAPMVLELRPDAGVTEVLATRIRPGTYDRFRFTIHKPEDFEIVNDPAVHGGTNGSDRYSIIVEGVYHDPFTYRSSDRPTRAS